MDGDNNAPCFSLAGLVLLSAAFNPHQASRLLFFTPSPSEPYVPCVRGAGGLFGTGVAGVHATQP